MESIACGTPVLGAEIGGIPELVEQGVTGELFRSGDENDLINKKMCIRDSRITAYWEELTR